MSVGDRTGQVLVCACNLVADGDSYLLVRETKPSARGRLNLPAGTLEVGETLVEAAERECREETGLLVRAERLVGIYQCPRTSEGFAVVNFVFASTATGGELTPSRRHPDVAYFSRTAIKELAARHMLRGTHIQRAIDDYEAGFGHPPSLVQAVRASPLPADGG